MKRLLRKRLSVFLSAILMVSLFVALPQTAKAASGSWMAVGSAAFSPAAVSNPSLKIDEHGTPYIAYTDLSVGAKLTVMKFDGTSWVPVGGSTGISDDRATMPSLEIDSSGTPYVAYIDRANNFKLTVKKFDGTSWVVVGGAGFSTYEASTSILAVDSHDNLYVASLQIDDSSNPVSDVRKFNGTNWVEVGSLGFASGAASYMSFAMDSSDTPYFAYQGGGSLSYVMKFDGTSWVSIGSVGETTTLSLAMDNHGTSSTPYLAYVDANTNKVSVKKFDNGTWQLVGSDGISTGLSFYPSLAIDSRGTPYVTFQDIDNDSGATVMKYDGTNWVVVGSAGFSGGWASKPSLALDSSGRPYVAYAESFLNDQATVMKYTIPPTTVDAANNTVSANPASIAVGDSVTLTVVGDRQSASGSVTGDERYIPLTWSDDSATTTHSYTESGGTYTAAYKPSAAGTYTVTATFQKQTWDGTQWNDVSGTTDTKTTTVVVSPAYTISTIAGTGVYSEDSNGAPVMPTLPGAAASTEICRPTGVAFDSAGNMYFTDYKLHVIFKVDADGTMSRLAGSETGVKGSSGDGGPAIEALLRAPTSIAIDSNDNLYFVDDFDTKIRKIAADGTISTVPPVFYGGSQIIGLAVDGDGKLYVSEANAGVYRLNPADGEKIDQVFGEFPPVGIAVDDNGDVYAVSANANMVFKAYYDINDEIWHQERIAGTNNPGYTGDGGLAMDAALSYPTGIAVDSAGNLFITDYGNNVIRYIDAASENIYTIAGNGVSDYSGGEDGGPALNAGMGASPYGGIAIDRLGNVYFTDDSNSVIRKISPAVYTVTYDVNGGSGTAPTDSGTYKAGATVNVANGTGITKTGCTFAGWSLTQNGEAINGSTFTMLGKDVVLYALWTTTATGNHSVAGTVVDDTTPTPSNVEGATVRVMQGNTQFGSTELTDADGLFSITGVPDGTYNLVVTKDNRYRTVCLTVSNGDFDFGTDYIVLPVGDENSRVAVKGSTTPEVVVDGLNTLFSEATIYTDNDKDVVAGGGSVIIKMIAEGQDANSATGATDIQTLAGGKTIGMYLDLSLLKTVIDTSNNTTNTTLSTVNSLIKVVVPFDLSGKTNIALYRYHAGTASLMTNLGSTYLNTEPSNEGYALDTTNNQIVLWVKNFSTYAVGYDSGASGGGGGSSLSSCTITASAGQGGTISPNGTASVTSGGSKTFTITPETGYVISDVLVDGKSVGAVSSYTFSNVTATHTITAVFVKATGLPYYLDASGNKVFIGFSSDDSGTMQYIAPDGKTVLFQVNPKSFTDTASHWAKSYIDFVTQREIFVGTGTGVFSPNTGMTRAMLATVIGRLYERSNGPLTTTGAHQFTDCDYGSWYGSYVDWCSEQGIIQGSGSGKFEPERLATRQEMAAILYRFAEFMKQTTAENGKTLSYTDAASIASWAQDAALYCQETGIITGRDGGAFAPTGTATRAEVATILERFIELVV